jgi:hypothetical protein
MWTDEDLQFDIQKLRLKHVIIPVKNQGSSAGISITLRVGQLMNCASIPGSGTRFFLARSQSCDKRLLASSRLSVRLPNRPSVHMQQLGSHWKDFQEI